MRVATGLAESGYLAEIKAWKEPKDISFNEEIGFWDKGSQCDKARYLFINKYVEPAYIYIYIYISRCV